MKGNQTIRTPTHKRLGGVVAKQVRKWRVRTAPKRIAKLESQIKALDEEIPLRETEEDRLRHRHLTRKSTPRGLSGYDFQAADEVEANAHNIGTSQLKRRREKLNNKLNEIRQL